MENQRTQIRIKLAEDELKLTLFDINEVARDKTLQEKAHVDETIIEDMRKFASVLERAGVTNCRVKIAVCLAEETRRQFDSVLVLEVEGNKQNVTIRFVNFHNEEGVRVEVYQNRVEVQCIS